MESNAEAGTVAFRKSLRYKAKALLPKPSESGFVLLGTVNRQRSSWLPLAYPAFPGFHGFCGLSRVCGINELCRSSDFPGFPSCHGLQCFPPPFAAFLLFSVSSGLPAFVAFSGYPGVRGFPECRGFPGFICLLWRFLALPDDHG